MIELENRAGIYCYINLVNWKKYVGQSVTVQKRILHHHEGYLKKKDVCHQGESPLLWKAVRKYGRDNFEVFVIEYCDVDDLDDKEIFWIERLKSNAREWGYNLTTGGESNFRGVSPSPETLQKRVDAITRTELAGRKLTRSELPDRKFKKKVNVYQNELDIIASIHNFSFRKILFSMLLFAKSEGDRKTVR